MLDGGRDPEKPIALIVERDWKGVNISGLKKMMGIRISPISEIAFDHFNVPKDQVIRWESAGTNPLTTYRQVRYRVLSVKVIRVQAAQVSGFCRFFTP